MDSCFASQDYTTDIGSRTEMLKKIATQLGIRSGIQKPLMNEETESFRQLTEEILSEIQFLQKHCSR